MIFKRISLFALFYFLGNSGSIHAMEGLGNPDLELQSFGADINIIDHTGMSALHIAVHCERLKTLDQLLRQGARLDILTNNNVVEDAPESTIIPARSTVFHLAARASEKNAHPIQRLLLYHALFHPKENVLSTQALITFLCFLKKEYQVLYNNRFVTLMTCLVHNFSPQTLVNFLSSGNNNAHIFARSILQSRMVFLQQILSVTDEQGDTAYKLECRGKVKNGSNLHDTMLLPDLYGDNLEAFIATARTNTIKELPDTNIFIAAYTAHEQQESPSLLSWEQEKCFIC